MCICVYTYFQHTISMLPARTHTIYLHCIKEKEIEETITTQQSHIETENR